MRQGTPFTTCPRCGQTSRLPVITCSKCFFDATPPAVSGPLLGYVAIVLIALVFVGALAWQKLHTAGPAFLGTWSNNKASFTFNGDGTLKADAYFDEAGRFHAVPKRLNHRWSIIVGDLMKLERTSTDGKNTQHAARIQWTVGDDGKSLTLKGIGRTDNLVSTVKLKKKS